jgi:hypothetical protein
MAFTYDIGTDLGKVRFFLGDTTDAGHVLEDDELTYLLTAAEGNIYSAVADAYRAWAGKAVRKDYSYKLGDRSMDRKGVQKKLLEAAEKFDQLAADGEGFADDWPPLTQPVGPFGELLPVDDAEGV